MIGNDTIKILSTNSIYLDFSSSHLKLFTDALSSVHWGDKQQKKKPFLGKKCCKMKPKIRNTLNLSFLQQIFIVSDVSIEHTVIKSIHKRLVRTFQKFLIQNIYVLTGKVLFVWDIHIVSKFCLKLTKVSQSVVQENKTFLITEK